MKPRLAKHLLLRVEEFRSLAIQFISYQENIDMSSRLGQALLTIVFAVAQLEPDLIGERISAGSHNPKVQGKQRGRPRRIVDRDRLLELEAQGASVREMSRDLGIGYGTIRQRLKQAS